MTRTIADSAGRAGVVKRMSDAEKGGTGVELGTGCQRVGAAVEGAGQRRQRLCGGLHQGKQLGYVWGGREGWVMAVVGQRTGLEEGGGLRSGCVCVCVCRGGGMCV